QLGLGRQAVAILHLTGGDRLADPARHQLGGFRDSHVIGAVVAEHPGPSITRPIPDQVDQTRSGQEGSIQKLRARRAAEPGAASPDVLYRRDVYNKAAGLATGGGADGAYCTRVT